MSEWTPKNGDTFYRINDYFEIVRAVYSTNCRLDQKRVEAGNCFRSYDEAAAVVKKFKAVPEESNKKSELKTALPKITVEVFNRKDCPDWANYAAVDGDGYAIWFIDKPTKSCITGLWESVDYNCGFTGDIRFDNADWENSIIERPLSNKLPSWCKCGSLIWHKNIGYAEVTSIEIVMFKTRVNIATLDGNVKDFFNVATFKEDCREARCIVDAVDLVGKKVRCTNGIVRLITRCDPNTNKVDLEDLKGIPIGRITRPLYYQLIGEVKFKYQHRENGDWVD